MLAPELAASVTINPRNKTSAFGEIADTIDKVPKGQTAVVVIYFWPLVPEVPELERAIA